MLVGLLAWMLGVGWGGGQKPASQAVVRQEAQITTFRYVAEKEVKSVYLAGMFNNWNATATPMTRQPDGRTWIKKLPLEPGVYQYKFVINGNNWIVDPNAPHLDDGNGNTNSVLTVLPQGYKASTAGLGDGLITGSAVLHQIDRKYVVRVDKTHLSLSLRTRRNDVAGCFLTVYTGQVGQTLTMARYLTDELYDYWRATTAVPPQGVLHYAFRLKDGSANPVYDKRNRLLAGTSASTTFALNPQQFPPLETPDWVRDAVFYQIFPERFANGDSSNDPQDVEPWGSKPTYDNRMGGDLAGVLQHLDYLHDLGINALYFNPLFSSRTNHGYDTTDYLHVDPRFGSDAELKQLTEKVHGMGWHVVLDGVFNHTGVDFMAFQSLRQEGERSPYRKWYFIKGFPIEVKDGQKNYDGWFGNAWMPKLNVVNPETRSYLLNVATHWIREAGIDGWRLDAANEVNPDFWKAFRKSVRGTNPNTYILGETWGNASQWLQGDQWDAAMNYPWREATLNFFALDKSSPQQFEERLARIREDYPPAATAVMFNMLGSHDTERLHNLCKGDKARIQQAVLFQLTYPGVPNIYYGDEIGMEGGRDPDNRRAMPWNQDQWNHGMLDFYKKLLSIRHTHPVLRRGDYQTLFADNATGVFGFRRTYGKEQAVILFNRGGVSQQITLSQAQMGAGTLKTWFGVGATASPQGKKLRITLAAHGMALLGTP